MSFGTLLIQVASVLALVGFVSAIRWARGHEPSRKTFRLAYHGMTGALVWASVLLMVAILNHDFRFDYVVGYSSTEMPLIYLISAFWAGQPGTYLLWAVVAAGVGYFLLHKKAWQPAMVMACYVPTIGFQLALMLTGGGNPFTLANPVPPDGRGLNLLLQDPWMATHPPLVFFGYVAATVPAVLALVALLRHDEDGWLSPALRWSLASFVLLGFGIILGGFWAYKVLGWGGYWGWDPVENASLVPWIVTIALIHGLLVQTKTGSLRRSNLVMALSAYILVLYGTFLTRSGVLADVSVHSFPAGSVYGFLVAILLLAIAVATVAMARRKGPEGKIVPWNLSWPPILSVAVGLLFISSVFVLIGTSWPIVSFSTAAGKLFDSLGWENLKESAIRPPWYNTVSLPIYVLLLGLLAVGPFLAWVIRPTRAVLRNLVPSVAVAAVGTFTAWRLGGHGAGVLLLFFVALAAATSNSLRLVTVARHRFLNTGAALAHLGFALMFVGIVASSAWGRSLTAQLPMGERVEGLDGVMIYQGHVDGSGPQHRWAILLEGEDLSRQMVEVSMFQHGGDEQVFRRPGILRSVFGDLYIAPQSLDPGKRAGERLNLARGKAHPYGEASITFLNFDSSGMKTSDEGMIVLANVEVDHKGQKETAVLKLIMAEDGSFHGHEVKLSVLPGVTLTLHRISVEQGLLLVEARAPGAGTPPALTVEVSTKPLIGFLWAGTLLLSFGCCVAVARRIVDERFAARVREMASVQELPIRPVAVRHATRAVKARRRKAR